MAKKKTHIESEHYRGIIRDLKAENKRLKRQLKHYATRRHIPDEIIEDEPDEEVYNINTCPSCTKGELTILDLKVRKYEICSMCDYRKLII